MVGGLIVLMNVNCRKLNGNNKKKCSLFGNIE